MRMRPNQKLGMLAPSIAKPEKIWSIVLPRHTAAMIPQGTPISVSVGPNSFGRRRIISHRVRMNSHLQARTSTDVYGPPLRMNSHLLLQSRIPEERPRHRDVAVELRGVRGKAVEIPDLDVRH